MDQYLFIGVFKISIEQIKTLERPVSFFIGLGVVTTCGTLLLDVVKEVLMRVGFGKVPRFRLWKPALVFLQEIQKLYPLAFIIALTFTCTRELYIWSSARPAVRVASVCIVSDAYISSSR